MKEPTDTVRRKSRAPAQALVYPSHRHRDLIARCGDGRAILAIDHALELGVDGIQVEADVSARGDLIVLPGTGKGKQAKLSTEEERPPKLEDVYWRVADSAFLNVTIRDPKAAAPLFRWIEYGVQYGHSSWEHFLISSPDQEILKRLRTSEPLGEDLKLGFILPGEGDYDPDAILDAALSLELFCIHAPVPALTGDLVKRAHRARIKVLAEGVNSADDARLAFQANADGIVTDDPAPVREALEKLRHETGTAGEAAPAS